MLKQSSIAPALQKQDFDGPSIGPLLCIPRFRVWWADHTFAVVRTVDFHFSLNVG